MKKLITAIFIIAAIPMIACADYYGSWAINDNVTFTANLHAAATGQETAADGVVDLWIYEDDSATQIVDATMTAFDSITGLYEEKIQLTAASGFEAGKCYTVLIRAGVATVSGHTTHNFQILSQVDSILVASATPLTLAEIATAVAEEIGFIYGKALDLEDEYLAGYPPASIGIMVFALWLVRKRKKSIC